MNQNEYCISSQYVFVGFVLVSRSLYHYCSFNNNYCFTTASTERKTYKYENKLVQKTDEKKGGRLSKVIVVLMIILLKLTLNSSYIG